MYTVVIPNVNNYSVITSFSDDNIISRKLILTKQLYTMFPYSLLGKLIIFQIVILNLTMWALIVISIFTQCLPLFWLVRRYKYLTQTGIIILKMVNNTLTINR